MATDCTVMHCTGIGPLFGVSELIKGGTPTLYYVWFSVVFDSLLIVLSFVMRYFMSILVLQSS